MPRMTPESTPPSRDDDPKGPAKGSSRTAPGSSPAVEAYTLGPFATNCYLLGADGHPGCWIVDAGFDPEPLIARVNALNLAPELIVLTHAHVDHIAGLDEVRRAFPGVPVAIHADEAHWLDDPALNLSGPFGEPFRTAPAERLVAHGEVLTLGSRAITVLHTPGHSPGGISLHDADAELAIVGDTLFRESIGRHDFPTSNPAHLADSITRVLYALPDRTTVHPGHGPATTIAHEKRANPFVRADGPTPAMNAG